MAPVQNLEHDFAALITKLDLRLNHINQSLSRLQECTSSLKDQQQLSSELREDLHQYEDQVEALFLSAEECPKETTRREVLTRANSFQTQLPELRKRFRASLLLSKRKIDSLGLSRRNELLGQLDSNSEKLGKNNEKESSDDVLNSTNQVVTDSLRRTTQLMQNELDRSALSAKMLESSTATLRSTTTQHESLNVVMDTSQQIIRALEKSDWLDRILIISALLFFVIVVLFILKQRIVDRGIKIAFWWTRFIPDFSGDAAALDQMDREQISSLSLGAAVTSAVMTGAAMTVTTKTATNQDAGEHKAIPVANHGENIGTATARTERSYYDKATTISAVLSSIGLASTQTTESGTEGNPQERQKERSPLDL